MDRIILRRLAGFCLVMVLSVAAYSQGMYWEATMSGGRMGDRVAVQKMFYIPKEFKSESAEGGEAVILRLDKEVMTSLNPKDKTYWEVTFAEMGSMMKRAESNMDAAMAQMQKKMEGMSEEQRKMMEKMMKDRMPGQKSDTSAIEVTNSDEKKTISGYSCSKFTVTRGGKELLTIWATKEVKDFEPMRKDFKEFEKRVMEMNPHMPKGLAEGMQKVEGFPIETDMAGGVKQVVTKIERRSVSPSEFEVPSGYTKVKPPMMGEEKGETKE